MIKTLLLAHAAAAALFMPTMTEAHSVGETHFLETAKPYAPYEFLIGDWYSKLAGTDMLIHQQFNGGRESLTSFTRATWFLTGSPSSCISKA